MAEHEPSDDWYTPPELSRLGGDDGHHDDHRSAMTADVAKVEALVAVLKDALPELVTDALAAFKPDLPRFEADLPRLVLPHLSDDEWDKLKRDEDQRRARGRANERTPCASVVSGARCG